MESKSNGIGSLKVAGISKDNRIKLVRMEPDGTRRLLENYVFKRY